MTTVTVMAISLSVILAFLLGRCAYISSRRATQLSKLNEEIKKLDNRLDKIADASKHDRSFEIEEDEITNAYNVYMKVCVRESSFVGAKIEAICWCRIKSFRFADDKEFARLEATELLEKLNEK